MNNFRERAAEGLQVGDSFTTSRTFTNDDVIRFAHISRDYNPVHFDIRFAKAKNFTAPICHGLLVASLVTELGGQIGWLASSMTFRYKAPVYVGETVTCILVITQIDQNARAKASATLVKQDGVMAIEAEISGIIPGDAEQKVLGEMLSEGDPTNGLTDTQQSRAANRESTTLIASWWWLVLWTAYLGGAVLEPFMTTAADQLTGTMLYLLLAVMMVSFVYEAWEDWLGTMLMNCVISIPVVPVLLMVNIVRMFLGVEAWSLKQKAMFIGPQVLALALTFLHYLFTKKRWKREPPPHLRPKKPFLPYRPDVASAVKWAAAYLLIVLFAAGLFVLVLVKRAWPNFDIPVFWLAAVLLILLLTALFAVFLHNRQEAPGRMK
jgi:3-hydroxybutyryl-CoA dehydratase